MTYCAGKERREGKRKGGKKKQLAASSHDTKGEGK